MLLIDVDAFCKLAHWRILPHLPDLTGVPWSNIATVSSLRFRARNALSKLDGKLFRTMAAAELVLESMEQMAELGEPESETLDAFALIPQIDVGEAILLALVAADPVACLLTGDKKALKALAVHDCSSTVAGRVITLEQFMLFCLEKKGEEWFKKHVCPFKEIDTSIRLVMGSWCDNSYQEIVYGLTSNISEIEGLRIPPLTGEPTIILC